MSIKTQLLRHYQGKARLSAPELKEIDCKFELELRKDGKITLICNLTGHELHNKIYDGTFRPGIELNILLKGFTTESLPLRVEGDAVISSTRNSYRSKGLFISVVFTIHSTGRIHVGTKNWTKNNEIHFTLSNLRFSALRESEDHNPSIKLTLGSISLTLLKLSDYDERLAELVTLGGVNVTCAAIVPYHDVGFERLIELIENLCCLLSIATGTLISWPYLDIKSSDGTLVYTLIHPSISRSYNGSHLIDPRNPDDLTLFLESTFNSFERNKADFELVKVANLYIETRSNIF
jgi:hypothetical protein